MAKHYPDRFDRGEDFSESPDIPDEFKVCACCERCDVDMEPFMVLTSYGDTIESRYCYGRPSDAPRPAAHSGGIGDFGLRPFQTHRRSLG